MLVVGPSGVGKDTLLAGARAALAADPQVVFPQRQITRAADAGGEDHVAVDEAAFLARRDAGGYALSWQAHGHGYGVPIAVAEDLAAGRTVVVNVSRTVLQEAERRFARVRIVSLAVSVDVLAHRLAARGREDQADIARRLARAGAIAVVGQDVATVCNDGEVADAVAALVAAIRR